MKNEQQQFYKQEVSEIEQLEFIFSDYLLVPRAERTNIVFNLLNQEVNLSDFERKYHDYLEGYTIKLFNDKRIIGNEIIKLTNKSKTNIFYLEYRICFLLDISHSLFTYDFSSQMINIEKIEMYLKAIFVDFLNFKKGIKTFNSEDYLYSPKLIISLVAMGINEDHCDILVHEIYLEKSNFDEQFDMIMRKLKRIIIDSQINFKKILEKNEKNNDYFKIHTTYLNKMLDQSLYILDLLPKKAVPILIIFTDTNLYINKIGNYNNILMQLNRIDININIINIYSENCDLNLFSLGYTNNETHMKYICNFTGGTYFNEPQLMKLLKIEKTVETTKNIVNLNMNRGNINVNDQNIEDYYSFGDKSSFSHLIFCKQPLREKKLTDFISINNEMLQLKFSNTAIDEAGFNLFAIDQFKLLKRMKIFQKEKFEQYKLKIPYQRLIEIRIRESFLLMKNSSTKYKYNSRIKFEIPLIPNIIISYIVKDKSINDKNFISDDRSEKIIKIKVKAPFYLFNYMKIEYLKNKNNVSSQGNSSSYIQKKDIIKVINFIREIMCSDKLLSNLCSRFDNDFDIKNPKERENFINSNSSMWEILSNLSLHTWHRFFNVEMFEFSITKKENKNIDNLIKNFWNKIQKQEENESLSDELHNKCERAIKTINCEIEMKDIKIKLLDKSTNQTRVNKKQNGFCLIKYIKVYDNVGCIYLGFFQSFITIRKKILDNLKDSFEKEEMKNSMRHLLLLLPSISENNCKYKINSGELERNSSLQLKTEKNEEKEEKSVRFISQFLGTDNIASSIFTYRPYKKLIDSYIFKKTYKHTTPNKFVMEKFLDFIIKLRLQEDYLHINSCNNRFILVNKISISKVKNINEVEKIIPKRSLVIYILQLNQTRDELSFELCIEPVSGYYLYKISDTEARVFDETKFFNSVTNYYKNFDKHIFESIFNYCFLAKETIEAKLKKSSLNDNETSNKKRFSNKYDILFDSDMCLFDRNALNDIKRQLQLKKYYEEDLRDFLVNLNDGVNEKGIKAKQKINGEEIYLKIVESMELVGDKEYKIATLKSKKDIYVDIVLDFHTLFFDFFKFIMDYQFYTNSTHSFFAKIITRNTLLIIKFPNPNRLVECCDNQLKVKQSVESIDIYIHIKVFLVSLDKFNFNEKKFTDFLKEKMSIKTIDISESNKDFLIEMKNFEENFWNKQLSTSIKGYTNNQIFNTSPDEILKNLMEFVEKYYEVIFYKTLLISISDNSENIQELNSLKKYSSAYLIKYDLTKVFLSLNKECGLSIDFISNKVSNIISDNFEKLNKTSNLFYSRYDKVDKLDKGSNSNSSSSFAEEVDILKLTPKICKNNNEYLKKKSNLFLLELKFLENCDGEHKVDLNLQNLSSIFKEIYGKVKNLNEEGRENLSINILMKVYTVPEISDMYSERYVDENLSKNSKLTSIIFEKDYLQFYDISSFGNKPFKNEDLERMIPLYIQCLNKDYYVLISERHKDFMNRIFKSLKSMENLMFLEDLRISENTTLKNENLDYYKINELVSSIDNEHFIEGNYDYTVIDPDKFFKYLYEEENERNIIILSRNDARNCCYYIDFEHSEELLVKTFKKYYFDNLEYSKKIKDNKLEQYKIPTWLTFCIKNKIGESSVNISFKWIYFRSENTVKIEEINSKYLYELFLNITKKSQMKILIEKLRETNECDPRLFPFEEEEKSKLNDLKCSRVQPQSDSNINDDKYFKGNSDNLIDSSDYKLDLQYRSEFNVEYNIDEVYRNVKDDLNKSNNLINNRNDIYKIIDPLNENNLFIFKILLSEKRIAQTSSSFIIDNNANKNRRSVFSNHSVDCVNRSGNDTKITGHCHGIYRKKSLFLEIYGIQKVNNIIIKQLYELIQDKILIYKINFYKSILKSLHYSKPFYDIDVLSEVPQHKLSDYSDKIFKIINECFQNSLIHWNSLLSDPSKLKENEFELIYTFSDRVDLINLDSNFSVLTKLNSSLYFDNIVDYFKLFRKNKIALFTKNNEKKMLIIPESPNYIFVTNLESSSEYPDEKKIGFEMLIKKENLDCCEKYNDYIMTNPEVSEIIYKFLEDLLYVSYLLVIKAKK